MPANPAELDELGRLAFSIAYRMIGSVADAEDVVQETLLRMHRSVAGGEVIESPRAYVATLSTRLGIDHLRSARVRREEYVGPWLPEPVVEDRTPRDLDIAESISMAFLVLLETLSPIERAVFVLHESFDYSYREISAIVEKSEQNCRKIFARARRHIDAGKPRFEVSGKKRDELARRFILACNGESLDPLLQLLAADATFYGDGGGKVTAATRPVLGRDRVARLLQGLFTKGKFLGARLRHVDVNDQPGVMIFDSLDRLISVMSFDVAGGVVQCIRSVVNPEKLRHLGPLSDWTRLPERRNGVPR